MILLGEGVGEVEEERLGRSWEAEPEGEGVADGENVPAINPIPPFDAEGLEEVVRVRETLGEEVDVPPAPVVGVNVFVTEDVGVLERVPVIVEVSVNI